MNDQTKPGFTKEQAAKLVSEQGIACASEIFTKTADLVVMDAITDKIRGNLADLSAKRIRLVQDTIEYP